MEEYHLPRLTIDKNEDDDHAAVVVLRSAEGEFVEKKKLSVPIMVFPLLSPSMIFASSLL